MENGKKAAAGAATGKENKPNVWFSLKKSLHCKSEPSDVYDPKSSSTSLSSRKKQQQHHIQQQYHENHINSILSRRVGRSGCSRSIANLRDVIHGSKRHIEKPPSCSPRSIGSSEFLNPITHEVILSNSRCELKITSSLSNLSDNHSSTSNNHSISNNLLGGDNYGGGSTFVGTLRPGTPGPGGHPTMHYFNNPSFTRAPSRKSLNLDREGTTATFGGGGGGLSSTKRRFSLEINNESHGNSASLVCHKCGEQFNKWDALEAHHLSNHAVTELVEGDSSRKIVEIICRTSWLKSENHCWRIERVLKVHNTQKTIARFEDYRDIVKIKASKLVKKHPRCIADGNELLRFYGTTVACSLGINGSSSLCVTAKCCVCRIIRHGFFTKKEIKGGVGVFTTSTSGRAFESIEIDDGDLAVKKALIVCRVIAGRVHRPLENLQELAGQTGFDSLAGKVGLYSNIEELYLLNPRALLPCFVVICKP